MLCRSKSQYTPTLNLRRICFFRLCFRWFGDRQSACTGAQWIWRSGSARLSLDHVSREPTAFVARLNREAREANNLVGLPRLSNNAGRQRPSDQCIIQNAPSTPNSSPDLKRRLAFDPKYKTYSV